LYIRSVERHWAICAAHETNGCISEWRDISKAEALANARLIAAAPDLLEACRLADRRLLADGFTPIFEWTAPDNRIVISYPDSRLTLLAVREMTSGHYLPRYDLEGFAIRMGVVAVPLHSPPADANEFLSHARAIRGMEGFVVRFANGLWVKAKGEDYVLKHKAKESVLQEKNILALVLRGELDDVLPLLDPPERRQVEAYRDAVLLGVYETADHLDYLVRRGAGLSQKEFAVSAVPTMPAEFRSLAFKVRAGATARDTVVATVLKQCGSASGVETVRPLFGARFHADNDNLAPEQVAA
jgi:RNA ligase